MKVLAEIQDKKGESVKIISYESSLRNRVMALFRGGYPNSFDEYDLEFIEEFLDEYDEEEGQFCLVALIGRKMVGASMMEKVPGPQDVWETSYIFVRESERGRDIGRIMIGIQEERLKDIARISFAVNPGLLPKDAISYPFWKSVGYEDWAVLPGYFRDDLSGIFLVKRNPHYAIGRGISEDSGWEPGMADSLTGKRVSQKRYREIMNSLKPVPKEKWGRGLIDKESIVY